MLASTIILETILASSNSCPRYNCTNYPPTNFQCIQYNNYTGLENYSITPCINGLECKFSNHSDSFCDYPEKKLPADHCYTNSDCLSGICFRGICYGKGPGQYCNNTAECDRTTFCSEVYKICVMQYTANSPCNHTYQCINSATCESGVCINYFSLPNGVRTNNVTPLGLYPSCASGYALNGYCSPAPRSVNPYLTPCSLNSTCPSSSGTAYKNCTCGYDGNGYCPLFEGDPQVQQMIQDISSIIKYNSMCHTFNRFSYSCFSASSGYVFNLFLNWSANADLYLKNEWVKQINNPSCVNQTINADYTNIKSQKQGIFPKCPIYSCTSNTTSWNYSQCVFSDINILYSMIQNISMTSSCNNNYTCQAGSPLDLINGTCVDTTQNRYPGEYCNSSYQCTSGYCMNNTCIGVNYGYYCYNQYDCNPGLFCNISGLCNYLASNGDYCNLYMKCANGLVCSNNQCSELYSIYNGQSVYYNNPNYTQTGYSPACRSAFAVANSSGVFCESAPVSWGNTTCSIGNSCFDSSGTYWKNCICGFYGYGNCPEFEGDYHMQNAVYLFSSTVRSWGKCNSYAVRKECFEGSNEEMYNYSLYMTNITYYKQSPWLLNAYEDCLMNAYFSEYWMMMNFINNYNPNPPVPPIPPSHDCPAYPEYPNYPSYPPYPSNNSEIPEYPTYPEYPEYPLYPSDCNNTVLPAYPVYPAYPAYPAYA